MAALLAPTLEAVGQRGLLDDIETLHLDRGYDNGVVRSAVARAGLDDLVCAKVSPRGTSIQRAKPVPLECAGRSSGPTRWLSNFGQLRRNTDRTTVHRLAQSRS